MAHLAQMLRHHKYIDLATILRQIEADSATPNYVVHGSDEPVGWPNFDADDTDDTYTQRIIDADRPPSAFQSRIGQILMGPLAG